MRAARLGVHVRRADGTVGVSQAHQVVDLLLALDVNLAHVLQIYALARLLVDSHVVLGGVDQVLDALVIDLDHADVHAEHDVLGRVLDSREDRADHAWNDSLQLDVLDVRALHRVGLPGGGLAVGEDRAVEAVEDALDDRLGRRIVDFLLI